MDRQTGRENREILHFFAAPSFFHILNVFFIIPGPGHVTEPGLRALWGSISYKGMTGIIIVDGGARNNTKLNLFVCEVQPTLNTKVCLYVCLNTKGFL